MTTLSTTINGALLMINEQIIDDLMAIGYSHSEAVKVVTEFDGYDFTADAQEDSIDPF